MAAKQSKLTVTRKDAVELLTDLGFNTARKFTNDVITRRLGKMKMYLEAFEGTLSGKMQELADDIMKAGKNNIVLEGKEPASRKPKGQKASAGKKATGKKTAGKKASKKKSTSKKRIDCICDAICKLPKSGKSKNQIAKQADEAYVKAGGSTNVKQTLHHLQVILPALINFGIVKQDGDKLTPGK